MQKYYVNYTKLLPSGLTKNYSTGNINSKLAADRLKNTLMKNRRVLNASVHKAGGDLGIFGA